ncbi:hypothetical protein AC1031_014470 [Aphanomyces cochlioides]|nr:hypothetical protein AC1031_014470 [Aphanomyces cochlioides]
MRSVELNETNHEYQSGDTEVVWISCFPATTDATPTRRRPTETRSFRGDDEDVHPTCTRQLMHDQLG